MRTSTFWIIIFVFCIAGYFFEQFLRRKLNMEKRGFFGYKHVNSLHVKLEIVLFIIYFVSSMIYVTSNENANVGYALFIFFGTLWTLRAWMEWKFDRESKEYILSIIGLFAFVIMISLLLYFDPISA
ncbi:MULTISPECIES: DUF4181 domain-containing protein [Bacillus]|jgi:hypothetical protein|uniref:Polysugar degrading enzyme n=3 Tax=Bacillus cereus group TaxID=86661 RepID=Q736U1_BACC1|nr:MULTISPECIES: DUF4181 domain-containing protein [Bacillus]AAS41721.1 conserved hypothetical protein [Bacillus cereus ATCC 10987]ACM13050.1 conserved hypothetical protein [Bacillus cereus Q1]KMQ36373.1 polysugar degrading enzyme [Bacillus cereus]KXY73190.1 polysugar degrading enzyme [Bacillus cereus]MBY5232220.1 polysugar degrading enzyme [Bacillus paranthracis]